MKKLKKFIVVLLTVVMMISVMPVAYAVECEHKFNTETLVRPRLWLGEDGYFVCELCDNQVPVEIADLYEMLVAYGEFNGLLGSSYSGQNASLKIDAFIQSKTAELEQIGLFDPSEDEIYSFTEYEQEVVDKIAADLKKFSAEFRKFVVDNGIEISIDITDFCISEERYHWLRVLGKYDETIPVLENASQKEKDRFIAAREYVQENYSDDASVLTEETILKLKESLAILTDFQNQVVDCTLDIHHRLETAKDNGDGMHIGDCSFCGKIAVIEEHSFGEYVSAEDASCSKGETLTATCTRCDAVDVKEGEKAEGNHTDGDKDNLCDDCGEKIDETIEDDSPSYGEGKHKGYERYINMIKEFIRLFVSFCSMLLK